MGTIKDLQYKEFTSDTEYNVIHFETKASQVKTTENNSTAEVEIGQAKLYGKSRQAIMNGNFDIWQRGTSFDMSSTLFFTADRWAIKHDGTIAGTVSRQEFTIGQTDIPNNPQYFLRINPTSASGCGYFEFYQPIENVRTFAGEEVCFSFWAKAENSRVIRAKFAQIFGTGGSAKAETVYVDFTIGTTWAKYSGKLTIPSISGRTIGSSHHLDLCLTLPMNTAFSVDVSQFQVNEGSTLLPFCARDIEDELRKCMRYYEKSYSYDTPPATSSADSFEVKYVGTTVVNTQNMGSVSFKVQKVTSISDVIIYPYTTASNINRVSSVDGTDLSASSGTPGHITDKSFTITNNSGGSLTPTYGTIIFHWVAKAEFTTQ